MEQRTMSKKPLTERLMYAYFIQIICNTGFITNYCLSKALDAVLLQNTVFILTPYVSSTSVRMVHGLSAGGGKISILPRYQPRNKFPAFRRGHS